MSLTTIVFAGIVVLVLLSALNTKALLLVVLVFAVVSTMPGIAEAAGSLEAELLPGVTTNFIGLLRTLLAALMVVHVILLMRERWSLVRGGGLFFLLLWGYAVISLAWSPRWALGESLRLVVYFSLSFGIYFLTLQMGSLRHGNRTLLRWVFLLAMTIAIGSLVTFNFLPEVSEAGITDLDRGARLTGIEASPNTLASNLAIFIGLGMAFLLVPGILRTWRLAALAVVTLSVIPLSLTLSRSGWIGAGLAVGLALVLRRKWRWLFVLGLLMVVLLFGTPLGDRFLGDWQSLLAGADLASTRGYQNAYGRIDLVWTQAIQELETPAGMVLGRGAGTAQDWAFTNTGNGMHSEFLQIWIDFGFLGFGLLMLGFGVVIRRAFRLFRSASEPMGAALGLASLCVFAAMLPSFVWQHVFNGPSSWLLLIVWGLTLGAERWASVVPAAPLQLPATNSI